MNRASRLVSIGLLSVFLLVGCGARGVRIADLKDQRYRYDDKTVSVTGVVTSSWGLPLLPIQFYNVDDGTGEIAVLSRSGRSAPPKGSRVQVRGRVNELAMFNGRSLGLHLQEVERKSRRY